MNEQSKVYTCTRSGSTRVRKPTWKRTVSITLPQKLIEQAKSQGLNISKVAENALISIIDYLQTQNTQTVLDEPSFKKVQWTGRDLNPEPSSRQEGSSRNLSLSIYLVAPIAS
jgi:post-segregation antitoxin (ccd killing protein)